MINNTCDFERMSFMDDSLGYSQIKMHPDDEKHTSFWMLFGCVLLHDNVIWLEECGYNQQCAMSIISCDHIRKTVECYVDDIKIKSHTKNNHLHDLRMMLISCGLTSWRWTRQSPSWEFQVASSLNSLSHLKKFTLTPTRSEQYKLCSFPETSNISRVYKADLPTSKDSTQIDQVAVNYLHS